MIKRAIRSIRRKPKAVRDQFAFWIAVSVTGVVILFWIVTIPDRYNDAEIILDSEPNIDNQRSFAEMVSTVKDEFSIPEQLLEGEEDIENISEPESVTDVSTTSATFAATTTTNTAEENQMNVAPSVRIATYTASTSN